MFTSLLYSRVVQDSDGRSREESLEGRTALLLYSLSSVTIWLKLEVLLSARHDCTEKPLSRHLFSPSLYSFQPFLPD